MKPNVTTISNDKITSLIENSHQQQHQINVSSLSNLNNINHNNNKQITTIGHSSSSGGAQVEAASISVVDDGRKSKLFLASSSQLIKTTKTTENEEEQQHNKQQQHHKPHINETIQQQEQHDQEQQLNKKLRQTSFDIQLDLDNFVIINRCSGGKVLIGINKRHRRAEIRARPVIGNESASASKQKRLDLARIKLLSTVFTIESANEITTKGQQQQHSSKQTEQATEVQHSAHKTDRNMTQPVVGGSVGPTTTTTTTQEQGAIGVAATSVGRPHTNNNNKKGSGSGKTQGISESTTTITTTTTSWLPAVRLRANLTELYICFDHNGKLEAKVSR